MRPMSDRGRGLGLAAAVIFACGLIARGCRCGGARRVDPRCHRARVDRRGRRGLRRRCRLGPGAGAAEPIRSGVQVTAVAGVAVVATGLGSWLAAKSMFISSHDLGAFLVILITSAAGGAGAATACATTVSEASETLGQAGTESRPRVPDRTWSRRWSDCGAARRGGVDRAHNRPATWPASRPSSVDVSRRLDAARSQAEALGCVTSRARGLGLP